MAVRAHLPSLARRAEADPRVVHQHVKPRNLRADPGRKVPYLAERSQIGDITLRTAAKLRGQAGHARRIASVDKYLPAGPSELRG